MSELHADVRSKPSEMPERRSSAQPPNRQTGVVVAVTSTTAIIAMRPPQAGVQLADPWSVGSVVTIYGARSRIICFVRTMQFASQPWRNDGAPVINADVELLGEIIDEADQRPVFRRGISNYPQLGVTANRIRREDLMAIYDLGSRKGTTIGSLSQDDAIPAAIDIDSMLRKHFAVVGTTGVGKSCSVSILLRAAIAARPKLRAIIIDPHNEYTHAFRDVAHTVETRAFELPFWLFRFEEIVEVIFRSGKAPEDEMDFLRDAIPQARAMYHARASHQPASILKKTLREDDETPSGDAAQPYRMTDVITVIDEAAGRLEQATSRAALRALRARIESLINDPAYRFMFGRCAIDGLKDPVINRLFRLADERRPITILQLAGIPSDVVNASVSVLARLAFDLSIEARGRHEILLTCEEAHRYVPADSNLGFAPTRRALSRIAKEGRKYGCYLGIVTQRPSELDPTILSQCSTIFAMRLSNASDQAIIRSAMPDSSTGVLEFISALSNREAIAFGEAFSTPMRMLFTLTDPDKLPKMDESVDAGLLGPAQAESGMDYAALETEMDAPAPAATARPGPVVGQAGSPGFAWTGQSVPVFQEPAPTSRSWESRALNASPVSASPPLRTPPTLFKS